MVVGSNLDGRSVDIVAARASVQSSGMSDTSTGTPDSSSFAGAYCPYDHQPESLQPPKIRIPMNPHATTWGNGGHGARRRQWTLLGPQTPDRPSHKTSVHSITLLPRRAGRLVELIGRPFSQGC